MECKFCLNKNLIHKKLKKFRYCENCRIFIRSSGDYQTYMLNEKLEVRVKPDLLSKNLVKLINNFSQNFDYGLLDFGCGNGRFLVTAREYYDRNAGVEISQKSKRIAFKNGVEVHARIPLKGFEIVTFWHSLEHLPYETLQSVLNSLSASDVQWIYLSVPNAESFTTKFFGDFDTFVDSENHSYIYSVSKLISLFGGAGFTLVAQPRIIEYSVFGAFQSSLNVITNTKNELYLIFKRGMPFYKFSTLRHISGLIIGIPVGILVVLISILNKKSDSVINLVFSRLKD